MAVAVVGLTHMIGGLDGLFRDGVGGHGVGDSIRLSFSAASCRVVVAHQVAFGVRVRGCHWADISGFADGLGIFTLALCTSPDAGNCCSGSPLSAATVAAIKLGGGDSRPFVDDTGDSRKSWYSLSK